MIIFIIILYMFKKTLLIAGASYFLIQKKIYCSPEPPLSMILRGAYENKIRRFSPPEKIFDVFATEYENGRLYMSIIDLLKAICFYNYSYSVRQLIFRIKMMYKNLCQPTLRNSWVNNLNFKSMITLFWPDSQHSIRIKCVNISKRIISMR